MGEFDESGKDAVPVILGSENIDNLSKPGESPQPQGYSQQPCAPQPQGYPQQPYTPQPQGYAQQPYTPQPQGYPQQPYTPQPQGYAQQPYAPQPQSYPQQPYVPQPQGYPQQPYAPQPQGYQQQPYTPQSQGYAQQPYAPQPQGYPQQPYAPQPQGYQQQPYAPQPQGYTQQPYAPPQSYPQQEYAYSKPSDKPNAVSFIIAVCFTASIVLQVLLGILGIGFRGVWINHVTDMLNIGAGVLLILGTRQRSKVGNTLFGVGLFIVAAGHILSILVTPYSYYLNNMIIIAILMLVMDIAIPSALTVSGIACFVSNDSLAYTKQIMMIVMIAAYILSAVLFQGLIIGQFVLLLDFLSLFSVLTYAALGVCVIRFTPVRQTKKVESAYQKGTV